MLSKCNIILLFWFNGYRYNIFFVKLMFVFYGMMWFNICNDFGDVVIYIFDGKG